MKRRSVYFFVLCIGWFAVTQFIVNFSTVAFTHTAQTTKPNATTATFIVNTADDHDDTACTTGDCSLREAINAANANAGADTINFAIGSGIQTINVLSALPLISSNVVIDATTQPGYTGSPIIELNGAAIASSVTGLNLFGSNITIRGFVINRFNGNGISISGGSNILTGNYIGTNVAGNARLGNAETGIVVSGGTNNLIGGTTASTRNVISGNDGNGITVLGAASGTNQILGNYIGTDATASFAIANKSDGISLVNSSNNSIGSTASGAGNVISGNANGIHIVDASSTNNSIVGNFIGTNANGTAGIANQFAGIDIFGGVNNLIGGTTAAARNIISGNTHGINLNNSASGTLIRGNFIGTKADGVSALGNALNGIIVSFSATNNTIGGVNTGDGNTIAFNRDNGIFIGSNSSGNAIEGNAIFSNLNLGIDLNPTGVTANDTGDADSGANNLQNFPLLTAASTTVGGGINIQGTLNSTASTAFRIELFANPSCSASGNGEGRTFLGFTNVTTDGSGNASFNVNFSTAVTGGSAITATATRTVSPIETSEFSPCRISTSLADLMVSQTASPNPVTVGSNLTFTITATNNGPDAVTNAVVTDNLPASVTFVSCNSTNGGICGGTGNNRTVTLPTLASGASATITFVAQVACNLAHNATISNTATISSAVSDPVANNSASASATVNHPATQISPTSQTFSASANGGNVSLTFPAGCSWTAISNAAWITVLTGSGSGSASISYAVAANSTGSQRTGTITIAGLTFTVTQSAEVCSYAVSPSGVSLSQAAANGTINVTAQASCGWKALSNDAWIQITSGSPGTGNGAFTYSVDANTTGTARNGSITLQDRTISIHQSSSPTAVKLISFSATGYDDGVLLEWQTGQEVDNLGFHLYREENGQRVRVTPDVIAGSALMAGSGTVMSAGNTYSWWDALPKGQQKVQYILEDIDLNGTGVMHDAVAPQFLGGQPAEKTNAVLLSRLGNQAPHLGIPSTAEQQAPRTAKATSRLAIGWELAAKAAVKIAVREDGWYRVTQSELVAAGLNANVNPRFLQLYAEGIEQPMLVKGAEDGSFDAADAIEFYGTALDTPATDRRVYWLIAGAQPGKRIAVVKSIAKAGGAASFRTTIERRDRTIYFSSLRNGERENFFGAVITRDAVVQTITLQHLYSTAQEMAALEIAVQGVTTVPHFVQVSLNGAYVGAINFDGQAQGVMTFAIAPSRLQEGANQIQLVAQGGANDINLVDFIRLTYPQTYTATQDTLRCTANLSDAISQTLDGFSDARLRVVDVTDASAIQELQGNIEAQRNGYSASVLLNAPGPRTLLAFTEAKIKHPISITANQVSAWHDSANKADLLILTHGNFINSLAPLKALREQQGLVVEVVNIEDLYDEYSFGEKQPQAIKDFLLAAKNSWKIAPRYVLFAGDASFDSRNYLGAGDFDFVPSKLIDTAFMETVSDDWFADFNDDGLAEMFTGRLPFRTNQEADTLVAKLIAYDSTGIRAPIVKKSVLLVADRNEGFDFEAASNQLRALVPATFNVQEIYRSRMDDATAKRQLLDAINSGQTIVNYVGHGSVNLWRGVLTANDLSALQNQQSLPFVVTMTCLNGYFQDPVLAGLAEGLMKAEGGGAIAVWASSALTEPNPQATMNQQMYRILFDASGGKLTLGEATARAKATVSDRDIRRTWILFGDPTIRLK